MNKQQFLIKQEKERNSLKRKQRQEWLDFLETLYTKEEKEMCANCNVSRINHYYMLHEFEPSGKSLPL